MAGIRVTDKQKSATVQQLVGIRTSPTLKVAPIDVEEFAEQLLAGEIGDRIASSASGNNTKDPARTASSTNIDIATGLVNGATIGGVVVATGNKVLLFGQSDGTQNGTYPVVAAGASARTADADSPAEILGMRVFISEGTHAGKVFDCVAPAPITVGVTSLPFRVGMDMSVLNAAINELQGEVEVTSELIKETNAAGVVAQLTDGLGFGTHNFLLNGGYESLLYDITPDDYDGLVVRDYVGFVFLRVGDGESYIMGFDGSDASGPSDITPYLGPNLFGWAGEEHKIYLARLLGNRADAARCQMTLVGASGVTESGAVCVPFKADELGATATLTVRPREWDGTTRAHLPLTVRAAPNPPPSPTAYTMLCLGDSNGQGAPQFLKPILEGMGYSPTFIGTRTFGGVDGEGRSGWELSDVTYRVIDKVTTIADTGVPATDFAAYNALNDEANLNINPYLRAEKVGDSPTIVVNGMVLDFERFRLGTGLAVPDQVLVGYITNSVRDRTLDEVYSSTYDDYMLLFARLHAAWPDVEIIVWFAVVPETPDRDALMASYVAYWRAALDAIRVYGSSKVCYVHSKDSGPPDAGFELAAGTTDITTGVTLTTVNDPLHQLGGVRLACFRTVAAASACVALDLI